MWYDDSEIMGIYNNGDEPSSNEEDQGQTLGYLWLFPILFLVFICLLVLCLRS